jgi:hypothetical protein
MTLDDLRQAIDEATAPPGCHEIPKSSDVQVEVFIPGQRGGRYAITSVAYSPENEWHPALVWIECGSDD